MTSENERHENVWTALTEETEQALIMTLRSDLMADIQSYIKARALTQAQAAEFFGITQPRISDLLRGKMSKFNVESLLELQQKCGHSFEWKISKAA